MIKRKYDVLGILTGSTLVISAYAVNIEQNAYAFMAAGDMRSSGVSNITITNRTGAPISVSGLFIASFDVNDCSACTGNVLAGDNLGGAVVSPVFFKTNQSLPIGQNYLYNMIYNGLSYVQSNIGSPCALPGCSWPGDDTNVQGWCITINVISLDSSYTYSNYVNGSNPPASVAAYGAAGNSPTINYDYKYDLIDPNTLGTGNACLGPIVCNDKTLTCQVASAQNESFEPYN